MRSTLYRTLVLLVLLLTACAVSTAATYTVTTTADSGPGSLRDAISYANASSGVTIAFNIPTTDPGYSSGYWKIHPSSELPVITALGTVIDGSTQTANRGDTNPAGPEILLYGQPATTGFRGLVISAWGCRVNSLAICAFGAGGIDIRGSACSSSYIRGCYIGIDPTGTQSDGNAYGVRVEQGTYNNNIGGPNASDRNVISGNTGPGIHLTTNAYANYIYGNYIGTNATGDAARPNENGIMLDSSASSNIIGGTTTAATGNVISGNSQNGVLFDLTVTGFNTVKGNKIGTNAAGTAAVPNQNGVSVTNQTHYETIEANQISGNTQYGVTTFNQANNITIKNNYIGTNAAGTAALPNGSDGISLSTTGQYNTIVGNVISGNGQNGLAMHCSLCAVKGNKIGTTQDGSAALPNADSGIAIYSSASNNTIGGTTPADRNIISGNSYCGIEVQGSAGNNIYGNYIGTNALGAAAVSNGMSGVQIDGASTNRIGGTSVGQGNYICGNGLFGVQIYNGSNGNYVQGNKIGVGTNSAALANVCGGVYIGSGSYVGSECANNVIGGTITNARNIISGNGWYGIELYGEKPVTGNLIQGNYIGTDPNGLKPQANSAGGVYIHGNCSSNSIQSGNIISGNGGPGVLISGAGAASNTVQANRIGMGASNTLAVPNYLNGVVIEAGANHNTIGGSAFGAFLGNTVCGHTGSGILIKGSGTSFNSISGNAIGIAGYPAGAIDQHNGTGITIQDGASDNDIGVAEGNIIRYNPRGIYLLRAGTVRNEIKNNSIADCSEAGITLVGVKTMYGVSCSYQNSTLVPNFGQVYPCITKVGDRDGGIDVSGFLNSAPNKTYTIQFFLSLNKNPSGFGDGQQLLGSATVDSGPTGIGYFHKWLPLNSLPWQYVAATATDSDGNTSEFSNAVGRNDSLALLTIRSNDLTKGSTTPPANTYAYVKGTSQAIEATALPGYVFDHWDGGVVDPAVSTASVIMDADKTVTAQFISGIAAAKKLPNTRDVTVYSGIVTAKPDNYTFWVEALDRSSGILVYKPQHGINTGSLVNVSGTLATEGNGERSIRATTITQIGDGYSVEPMMMPNRSVGGGDWFYNTTGNGEGQKGVMLTPDKPSTETNNIGVLIRTMGKVTASYEGNNYFFIDDGSGLLYAPFESAPKGVTVLGRVPKPDPLPEGWTPVGHHVIVTGISTCQKGQNSTLVPRIYATDIVVVD